MKIIILISFFCGLFGVAFSEGGFEGELVYSHQTKYDTLHYNIQVKQKLVRVDIVHNQNDMRHSYIVDYDEGSYIVLDHHNKSYFVDDRLKISNIVDLQSVKTKNFRVVNGVQCYQWRVKSVKNNTEIAYWVSAGNYNFIAAVMESLPFEENVFRYFSVFEAKGTVIPVLVVERTLLRDEKVRMNLDKIKRKPIQDKIFKIPDGYELYSK